MSHWFLIHIWRLPFFFIGMLKSDSDLSGEANREPETQRNARPFGSSMAERQRFGCLDTWPYNCKQTASLRSPILILFQTTHVASRIINGIVRGAVALGVDEVDLVQHEGCGYRNLGCDDQSSIHLHLLEGIRKRLPKDIKLSYTFPCRVI